jgi:hypothetical protein
LLTFRKSSIFVPFNSSASSCAALISKASFDSSYSVVTIVLQRCQSCVAVLLQFCECCVSSASRKQVCFRPANSVDKVPIHYQRVVG